MIRTLSTAATGLEAQQANIERISNDLANVNTDGYKRARTEFQDLLYETKREPGGAMGANSQSPVGVQTGMGVRVGATYKMFEQGPARITNHPYDLMIEGRGFLPLQLPNGEIGYTRNGSFHIDAQGRMQTSNGSLLIPQITIPRDAQTISIGNNGEVKALMPNQGETVIGQIQLITFQNEQGLLSQGESTYKPTLASGAPVQGIPGENGIGAIMQGALEGSNVDVAKSMVDMISTQRAYKMNTKVMGVADQMWGATTGVIK